MADSAERPPPEGPEPPSEGTNGSAGDGGASPYRNLWVPLVVVPAGVVGVIVLVFVFFSSIAGSEATPRENLERMVRGGANEREQAAFNLVRQLRASAEGLEQEWDLGPTFLEEVRRAWGRTEEDDLAIRFVLAQVLAQSGDPQGVERLIELLGTPDELDPDGRIRFDVLVALQRLEAVGAAPHVLRYLEHPDLGLRVVAASALGAMPGPASRDALRGLLDDPVLEVRGTAAVSLSRLGDDGGARVLVDLAGLDVYEAVRREEPRKYASAQVVRENRIRAIEALARLDRPADRILFEALAADDPDLEVREAAQRALGR